MRSRKTWLAVSGIVIVIALAWAIGMGWPSMAMSWAESLTGEWLAERTPSTTVDPWAPKIIRPDEAAE